MTNNRKRSTFGQFIDIFGSAVAVSSAVKAGRTPLDRDLNMLGIDPRNFGKIRR